jgi:hypothetical protein
MEKVFDVTALPRPKSGTPVFVCMRILRRSWDFMVGTPLTKNFQFALFDIVSQTAEVVRPLCMSTISDIAIIA